MNLYSQTDKFLEKAKKYITNEFFKLSRLEFDELNVLNTKRITKAMYERLLSFNKEQYLEIAKYAETYANSLLGKEKKSEIHEDDIKEFLETLNTTTGYFYGTEADRKRMRLNEEVLVSKELEDKKRLKQTAKRSGNLWYTQTSQFAQDIADYAEIKTFKKAGIEKVMWHSEHDEKTCDVCSKRDGHIYPINKIPAKDHYHCRCWVTPVR